MYNNTINDWGQFVDINGDATIWYDKINDWGQFVDINCDTAEEQYSEQYNEQYNEQFDETNDIKYLQPPCINYTELMYKHPTRFVLIGGLHVAYSILNIFN